MFKTNITFSPHQAIRRERTVANAGNSNIVVAGSVDSPPVAVVTVASPAAATASPAMQKHRYCNDICGR